MPEPMELVGGKIPRQQKELIDKIGGENGTSAGLRLVVGAGLSALTGTGEHVAAVVDELAAQVDRLASISGRRTPSGAWWAPCDAAMPAPELLAPAGDVIASPHRVVLAGCTGALMVDTGAGRIVAEDASGSASAELELGDLAAVAGNITAGLARLAQGGPGRLVIVPGLELERRPDGIARVALQGIGAAADVGALWMLAAEVTALAARQLAHAVEVREALEQQLQEASR